jgi:amino acid transporter
LLQFCFDELNAYDYCIICGRVSFIRIFDMAQLKRQLGLLDIFAVAAGAMISSGLFVLPAIAYVKAGPAVILSYLLASILVVPSLLSKAELATAMPRAGGTYFFVERSLGPLWGMFGGLANWFSVALKSAFAVVGMAVFIEVVLQVVFHAQVSQWHLKTIAVLCCVGFTALNIVSVKHTGRFGFACGDTVGDTYAVCACWDRNC